MVDIQDSKRATGPILRATIAIVFLAIAAGAIAFSALEHRRQNPPVDESTGSVTADDRD